MIPYADRNEKFYKIIELLESLVFSNREIKKYQCDTRILRILKLNNLTEFFIPFYIRNHLFVSICLLVNTKFLTVQHACCPYVELDKFFDCPNKINLI